MVAAVGNAPTPTLGYEPEVKLFEAAIKLGGDLSISLSTKSPYHLANTKDIILSLDKIVQRVSRN